MLTDACVNREKAMKYRAETMVVPYDPREPLRTGNIRKLLRVVGPGILHDFSYSDQIGHNSDQLAKILQEAYDAGRADAIK